MISDDMRKYLLDDAERADAAATAHIERAARLRTEALDAEVHARKNSEWAAELRAIASPAVVTVSGPLDAGSMARLRDQMAKTIGLGPRTLRR